MIVVAGDRHSADSFIHGLRSGLDSEAGAGTVSKKHVGNTLTALGFTDGSEAGTNASPAAERRIAAMTERSVDVVIGFTHVATGTVSIQCTGRITVVVTTGFTEHVQVGRIGLTVSVTASITPVEFQVTGNSRAVCDIAGCFGVAGIRDITLNFEDTEGSNNGVLVGTAVRFFDLIGPTGKQGSEVDTIAHQTDTDLFHIAGAASLSCFSSCGAESGK